MRILIAIIVIVGAMSFTDSSESSQLYKQSLLLHFEKLKPDTIFLLKCFDIEIPSRINGIEIVDISKSTREFLKGKDDLYAVKLMPIELNKGNIQISIIDYIIREKDGELTFSNAGGKIFTYKYEPNSKLYKLIKKTKNTL